MSCWKILVVILAIAAAVLYIPITEKVEFAGLNRTVRRIGHSGRQIVPLEGCEDASYHDASKLLYVSCGNVVDRRSWLPALGRLDTEAKFVGDDAVYVVDPETQKYTKLEFRNYDREFHAHGIGIFNTEEDPNTVYVFLVNHVPNKSINEKDPRITQSVVSIFKHRVGDSFMVHVETVDDPLIAFPNDILPVSPSSFYVTNDHHFTPNSFGQNVLRHVELFFSLPISNVVFRDENKKTKVVANGIVGANGICKGPGKKVYVVGASGGQVHIYERNSDHSLKKVDTIQFKHALDNVSYDPESDAIYVAAHVKTLDLLIASRYKNKVSPSAIVKVTENTGEGKFFGDRYVKEIIYEEDGSVVNAATVAVRIPGTKKIWTSGLWGKSAFFNAKK